MKGVLVILDGVGDLPNKQLGGKTPLEAANLPNLDFLATRGELGQLYTVKPGFIPESDEAIVSLFGNELINSTRGQLEVRGTDIKLTRGDLALRLNFATIDSLDNMKLIDRRVARTLTTAEAEIFSKAINKQIKLPFKFEFKNTIQHRGVLVFRGGFSDNILGNDPTYSQGKYHVGDKIRPFKTLDDDENAQYTINVLNEFLEKVYRLLDKHPINEERRKKGLLPANYLLMRGAGIEPPKLKPYRKWMSVVYMPIEKGFAKTCGMNVFTFDYPKLKGIDAYKNLYEGLEKACKVSIKTLKKQYKKSDYAYIHIKEPDVPGHDNKPFEKVKMLEYIDKTLFKFLRKFAPPKKINIVVTADHSTPCKLKDHSADPVPVLFYNGSIPKRKEESKFTLPKFAKKKEEPEEKSEYKGIMFCEKEAENGKLGKFNGKDFLKKVKFTK